MPDYKYIQLKNLKLKDYGDNIDKLDYLEQHLSEKDLINEIFNYFLRQQDQLIFPAKSYAVAIIYSRLIEKYFGTPLLESLNDSNLFWETDRFFTPYAEKKIVYDHVMRMLDQYQLWDFEESRIENVLKTVYFFKQEFSI
jgi:hypothetical protein